MNTKPARGMRDFLPTDVRRREYVIGVIKEVYERYGFEPLETPAVENIETLTGKYGEEGNKLIYKILRRGAHESTGAPNLALRYDLTVPLARVVAEYREQLPKFFKRYQIQPVWRADRPGRGRFREFYQCDVDVLGSRSMVVEAEVCAAVCHVLTELGFTDFNIHLNHRQVLAGILDVTGVEREKHSEVLITLDKWDKIGRDEVLSELELRGITVHIRTRLIKLFDELDAMEKAFQSVDVDGVGTELEDWNNRALVGLTKFISDHEAGAQGIDELRSILRFAAANGVASKIKIDPRLARGLSYYTGAIMEVSVGREIGSLGGGGRYDELVGMFSEKSVPACGFSLGLERIVVVMTEREMFPASLMAAPAEVMVTVWDDESMADSLALATELRGAGLRVDLYPEAHKLARQFKYASLRGIPFVAVIGVTERERGEVSLKDMRTGAQQSLPRGLVAETAQAMLKG